MTITRTYRPDPRDIPNAALALKFFVHCTLARGFSARHRARCAAVVSRALDGAVERPEPRGATQRPRPRSRHAVRAHPGAARRRARPPCQHRPCPPAKTRAALTTLALPHLQRVAPALRPRRPRSRPGSFTSTPTAPPTKPRARTPALAEPRSERARRPRIPLGALPLRRRPFPAPALPTNGRRPRPRRSRPALTTNADHAREPAAPHPARARARSSAPGRRRPSRPSPQRPERPRNAPHEPPMSPAEAADSPRTQVEAGSGLARRIGFGPTRAAFGDTRAPSRRAGVSRVRAEDGMPRSLPIRSTTLASVLR